MMKNKRRVCNDERRNRGAGSMTPITLWSCVILALLGLLFVSGCETMDQVSQLGTSIAVASGAINSNDAESINRAASAVGKTFDDITPEQEYYIGRAVAATLLNTYRPLDNDQLTAYVNTLGQALARASEKPETFGGYHFLVLDSDEINAFAAPGGLILITRGLMECCPNEDALAAVLAHEIAHVAHADGLRAIKTSRLTSALTIMATESAKGFGGADLAEVTKAFEGSINDITHTLAVSGYSRGQERKADQSAVQTLKLIGYDPRAMITMLSEMQKRMDPARKDFAATHPPPAERIANVRKAIGSFGPSATPSPERRRRFEQVVADL